MPGRPSDCFLQPRPRALGRVNSSLQGERHAPVFLFSLTAVFLPAAADSRLNSLSEFSIMKHSRASAALIRKT